jgi:TonB family protein
MRHYLANDSAPVESLSGTPPPGWRIGIALAIAVLCGVNVGQAQSANEYQVKAAYLYNFAKSAVWSSQSLPDGSSALVIGVVGGDDEFVDILKKMITGKSIGTHPVEAKRVSTDDELKSCQLIFLRSSAGRKRTQAAVSALASASVLLVGEDEGFLQEGGMINLFLKNGTVRFEVDRSSLNRANIHLSPELLALANTERGSSNGPTAESRRLKAGPPPEYPELAQKMNIKGAVQVEASVRRDGTVKEVKVIGGHPLLADALAKAVMGWQYAPAAKDSVVVVRFVFGQ